MMYSILAILCVSCTASQNEQADGLFRRELIGPSSRRRMPSYSNPQCAFIRRERVTKGCPTCSSPGEKKDCQHCRGSGRVSAIDSVNYGNRDCGDWPVYRYVGTRCEKEGSIVEECLFKNECTKGCTIGQLNQESCIVNRECLVGKSLCAQHYRYCKETGRKHNENIDERNKIHEDYLKKKEALRWTGIAEKEGLKRKNWNERFFSFALRVANPDEESKLYLEYSKKWIHFKGRIAILKNTKISKKMQSDVRKYRDNDTNKKAVFFVHIQDGESGRIYHLRFKKLKNSKVRNGKELRDELYEKLLILGCEEAEYGL